MKIKNRFAHYIQTVATTLGLSMLLLDLSSAKAGQWVPYGGVVNIGFPNSGYTLQGQTASSGTNLASATTAWPATFMNPSWSAYYQKSDLSITSTTGTEPGYWILRC